MQIFSKQTRAILLCHQPFRSASKLIADVSPLTAISPIDGRYAKQCNSLRAYFSEYALMRYRVQVELLWFKRLFAEKIVATNEDT